MQYNNWSSENEREPAYCMRPARMKVLHVASCVAAAAVLGWDWLHGVMGKWLINRKKEHENGTGKLVYFYTYSCNPLIGCHRQSVSSRLVSPRHQASYAVDVAHVAVGLHVYIELSKASHEQLLETVSPACIYSASMPSARPSSSVADLA